MLTSNEHIGVALSFACFSIIPAGATIYFWTNAGASRLLPAASGGITLFCAFMVLLHLVLTVRERLPR